MRDAGYVDQVVRKEQYERDHSSTRITYRVTHYEAVTAYEGGEHITTANGLKALLDKLEAEAESELE
jgi:hypothetical protein